MTRTRVKFCGLTRLQDVEAAIAIGADAVGFVCYPGSRRFVPVERLAAFARAVPAFVTPVLLFVNADQESIARAIDAVPHALLQFHGDETPAECERAARPYVRAIRMEAEVDLLDCERVYTSAIGLLADTPAADYGGSGSIFDWARLPATSLRAKPLVLAGGLTETNVGRAIATVMPHAVDVSSGIEEAPGIKSVEKMRRFLAAVRAADLSLPTR
jgi:phosphoribosylanthranilate isomerase